MTQALQHHCTALILHVGHTLLEHNMHTQVLNACS
jgi:hypothetical protein